MTTIIDYKHVRFLFKHIAMYYSSVPLRSGGVAES